MEKLVKELGQLMPFKDSTDIGDLVLIAAKEPHMLVYALVTDIERDSSRKAEWWHVGLTFLTVPPQKATWTLRTPQMCGMEIFTMGGEERFIKAVALTPSIDGGKDKDQMVTGAKSEGGREKSFLKRVK